MSYFYWREIVKTLLVLTHIYVQSVKDTLNGNIRSKHYSVQSAAYSEMVCEKTLHCVTRVDNTVIKVVCLYT